MLELADAVVVGGGILGAAVSAALSRQLSRVLLIESDRCGGQATAGGFAWVNASSKTADENYHRLNAESCRLHLDLAAQFGAVRTGWNGGGSLTWALQSDADAIAALEARSERLQAWNYPTARVSSGEMRALEPCIQFDNDAVGLFAPSEGWISTPRLMRFYMDQIHEHKGEISEFTEATGITLDHRGAIASVETSRGRVTTRKLVVCAGVESDRIVGLIPGPFRRRSASLLTRDPGVLVETGPQNPNARVHRVCWPAAPGGLHMRPTSEGGVLIGADDTDAICARNGVAGRGTDHGDSAASSSAKLLLDRSTQVLPNLDQNARISTRICIRPMPTDGLPIVGELPLVAGAYVLTTHSGVTLAPLLSSLLADEIVTGRRSTTLAPYRPERLF